MARSFNDTQRTCLAAAAGRENRRALPFPDNLRAPPAAVAKTVEFRKGANDPVPGSHRSSPPLRIVPVGGENLTISSLFEKQCTCLSFVEPGIQDGSGENEWPATNFP